MIKINYTPIVVLALLLVFSFSYSNAQTSHPTKIRKSIAFSKSKRLRDVTPIPPIQRDRSWKNRVVENQEYLPDDIKNQPVLDKDPALQDFMTGSRSAPIILSNFQGVGNRQGVAPPDTEGDVGLDYYMQMINSSFEIYDKDGNSVYGPADNITLWDGFSGPWSSTNDGDPIVLYDQLADRWVASQFALPYYPNGPFYELVAVSATDDPTGEWNRYAFEFSNLPDYPKLSVWPDGYYMSINQFAPPSISWVGGGIIAMDRDAMLNGESEATMVFFDADFSYGGLLPADLDGDNLPPEGQPMVFLNLGNNLLHLWEVEIDWDNVDNSTKTFAGGIQTDAFSTNSISISQPGTSQKLDALSGRLMNRLQYRNFDDYQVMVTNHTVNAGSGRAGVRWYELRNYGDGWVIYQQGTYAPDDGDSRWMASVAMNSSGDIAVGYSVSGPSTYPSIRVAGQTSGAPMGLGVLDIDEMSIKEGSASQTGVDRWGDYSFMSVDAEDDNTFWYTDEYTNGGWNWKTQIASFGFVSVPSADFKADEVLIPVGETVNFTDLTLGIPDGWNWTFTGGTPENSTDQNPENILYDTEGTFDVQLIASNNLGADTIIKENYIEASSTVLPNVDFEVDKQVFCANDIVQFTDLTTIKPIQWLWEFSPSTVTFVNGTDENSENPEVTFDTPDKYSVTLTAWNLNGSSSLTKDDLLLAGGYQPFFWESFDEMGFDNQHWTVESPNDDVTWGIYEVGGTEPGTLAAGINFTNMVDFGIRDRLISPPFNLTGLSSAALEFQHAYAKKYDQVTDSLIIFVSSDCGESWTRVFNGGDDGNGSFATHEKTTDFWPETADDWCGAGWGSDCISVDLTPWAGQPDVRIAFETYCAFGNPLFIDNITISQYVNIQDKTATGEISVFPNPAKGYFSVQIPDNINVENIQMVNNVGEIVYQRKVEQTEKLVTIKSSGNFSSGIYLLKCYGSDSEYVNKLIIY